MKILYSKSHILLKNRTSSVSLRDKRGGVMRRGAMRTSAQYGNVNAIEGINKPPRRTYVYTKNNTEY